ncbi:hypothetical protein ACWDRB_47295 [Nonomuraea sp. NPDC003707]
MELFGITLNVTVPKPVVRLVWGAIVVVVVVVVLVQHGAAMTFMIG